MGGSSSSLPGEMGHQQLFDMTKDTRLIMNKLLDYGLHKIAVSEFVKLSSPEGCKNYVMFLTNSIHKLFYELQVAPGTDKRGVIFFRSIKDLTEPTAQEKIERQSLCLTLAYFYTRIFQIYGSIALTLIDDINDISQIGIFDGIDQSQSFGAPGIHLSTMSGGAFSLTTMGNFQFLKSYLTDQTYASEGFRTRYVGTTSSTTANIYFTAEVDGQNAASTQQGTFAIGYTGAKEFSYLPITSTSAGIGSNNLTVSFGKIKYQKKGDATEREATLPDSIKKSITISGQIAATGTVGYTYKVAGSTASLADYFNKIFTILVPYVRSLVEGTSSSVAFNQSERDVQPQLKISKIIQNLSKVKPLGHCIARGMQLLRAAPFDKDGISSICKPKFMESTRVSNSGMKTTVTRSGIPITKVEESPGLSALAQLFYDTVQFGTPQVLIGTVPGKDGVSSKDKYLKFIRTMSRMFGDTTRMTRAAASPDDVIKEGLDAISIQRDKELCKILGVSDQDMQLPNSVAKVVYESVKKLFGRQYNHAVKCGAIINRLFRVQRDQSSGYFQISLSPTLIQGGFPELNSINYDARELLMSYYEDCETTYLHGVQDIITAKRAADTAKVQQPQAQQQSDRQPVFVPRTGVQPPTAPPAGPAPPAIGPTVAGPTMAGPTMAGPAMARPTAPFRFPTQPQVPPRSAISSRGRTIKQPVRFSNQQGINILGRNEFQRRTNSTKRSRIQAPPS